MRPTPKATPDPNKHGKDEKPTGGTSERRSTKDESSASGSNTKMTHQVRQIPKPKSVEVKKEEPTEEADASSSNIGVGTYAGNMADSANTGPNNDTERPVDNLWGDYRGITETGQEAPADRHQTVNVQGHAVNPPPPSSRNKGKQEPGGEGGKTTTSWESNKRERRMEASPSTRRKS